MRADITEEDAIAMGLLKLLEGRQIPYLARGNVLSTLQMNNGYPRLDESFQSNIPGLYFTSLPATQDFGPFFGFVIGAPVAARVIGASIEQQLARS